MHERSGDRLGDVGGGLLDEPAKGVVGETVGPAVLRWR